MKKLHVIAVVMVLLIAAGSKTSAQTKIGYIRIDDIVGVMPELKNVNIDTVGEKFLQDSIYPQVQSMQNKYNSLYKDYQDTVKNSKAVRELIARELEDARNELSGVDGTIQQIRQYKQQEFLKPYYAKAKNAIDAVAKKGGYTHILSSDIFIVAPEGDDLSMRVLAELKIDLPKQPNTQPKPNTGGVGAGAGKPPVKNN